MRRCKTGELVFVKWIDSRMGPYGWEFFHDETATLPPLICETVGFVVTQNRDYVTLAMSVAEGCIMGRLTIPQEAIKQLPCVSCSALGSKRKRPRS